MSRRSERNSLRFCQRGRDRWVEIVTESHPTRVPRKRRDDRADQRLVTLSGRVRSAVAGQAIEDLGNFGTQFRTTALSSAPHILCFEDTASELDLHDDGSVLRAFRDRILQNLPNLLQQTGRRPLASLNRFHRSSLVSPTLVSLSTCRCSPNQRLVVWRSAASTVMWRRPATWIR